MNQKRAPSAANQELADWLTLKGHPTTAREIRTWRENGWVTAAIVEPQGYAKPTKATNPPEAFDQALAVSIVRGGKRTSPHIIALRLFANGYPIAVDPLRNAWRQYFDNLNKAFHRYVEGASDPFDSGEQLAAAVTKVAHRTKHGRYMLKKAKDLGKSPTEIVASAMTVVLTGMFGGSVRQLSEPPSFDSKSALDELHEVTGMSGFVDDRLRSGGSIVASHEELRRDNVSVFEHFTLRALYKASQDMTLDELITAREHALVMLDFMTAFARSTAMTSGPKTAFGLAFIGTLDADDEFIALMALLVAVLNAWMPGRLEALLPFWTVEADRHAARIALLNETPRKLRKYLGTQVSWSAVPENLRPELTAVTTAFRDQHPDLMKKILQPSVNLEELNI